MPSTRIRRVESRYCDFQLNATTARLRENIEETSKFLPVSPLALPRAINFSEQKAIRLDAA